MIDWALLKYRDDIENAQLNEEQIIIDDIIKQVDKKRDIDIHKMKKAMLKDESFKFVILMGILSY